MKTPKELRATLKQTLSGGPVSLLESLGAAVVEVTGMFYKAIDDVIAVDFFEKTVGISLAGFSKEDVTTFLEGMREKLGLELVVSTDYEQLVKFSDEHVEALSVAYVLVPGVWGVGDSPVIVMHKASEGSAISYGVSVYRKKEKE